MRSFISANADTVVLQNSLPQLHVFLTSAAEEDGRRRRRAQHEPSQSLGPEVKRRRHLSVEPTSQLFPTMEWSVKLPPFSDELYNQFLDSVAVSKAQSSVDDLHRFAPINPNNRSTSAYDILVQHLESFAKARPMFDMLGMPPTVSKVELVAKYLQVIITKFPAKCDALLLVVVDR